MQSLCSGRKSHDPGSMPAGATLQFRIDMAIVCVCEVIYTLPLYRLFSFPLSFFWCVVLWTHHPPQDTPGFGLHLVKVADVWCGGAGCDAGTCESSDLLAWLGWFDISVVRLDGRIACQSGRNSQSRMGESWVWGRRLGWQSWEFGVCFFIPFRFGHEGIQAELSRLTEVLQMRV